MRAITIVSSVLFVLVSSAASARETEFQISPRVGIALLRVDADRTLTRNSESEYGLNLGVAAAVAFPIRVVIEAGVAEYYHFDFLGATNVYRLSESYVALGYQFETDRGGVIFVPKIGKVRGKLHLKEGELFNPGREATRNISDTGLLWELTVQKRINDWMALGGSLRQNGYEFGSSPAVSFAATFHF